MGVLEYKNPYKFRDMTPVEAANQSTNCCLIEKNGSLSLKQTHTVGANKKFKNGMKFLLQRLSMHCLYGFRTVLERLQQLRPIPNTVQPVICFRPRVSLYDNPCPLFVGVQEPEIQSASDRFSLNPAPPTCSVGNYHGPANFF